MSISFPVFAFSEKSKLWNNELFSSSAYSSFNQRIPAQEEFCKMFCMSTVSLISTLCMPWECLPPHTCLKKGKKHKKTCTEDYTNKAFSHTLKMHFSLHCHAAPLILIYTATVLLIFKGVEKCYGAGTRKPRQYAFTQKNILKACNKD